MHDRVQVDNIKIILNLKSIFILYNINLLIQTLKKDNFGLTSQLMLGPFYNNEASITAVLNAGNKTSYMATSWTNFKL